MIKEWQEEVTSKDSLWTDLEMGQAFIFAHEDTDDFSKWKIKLAGAIYCYLSDGRKFSGSSVDLCKKINLEVRRIK